jgi:hypothetical protein
VNRAIALAALASAALAAQADSPAEFAYRLALTAPGEAAFFRVEIPATVHEGALRADLADLRIFNADGDAVAFAWLPPPKASREAAAPVELPIFPLRVETGRRGLDDLSISVLREAGGGTRVDLATRDGKTVAAERLAGYLADASAIDAPLTALTLPLPASEDISTRVRVEASDDLAAWRTLVAGAPLIALEYAGRRLARERIELPATRTKFLRITFAPDRPAPEIAALRAESAERVVDAPRQWREAQGMIGEEGRGDFVFDLRGLFPVDRVALKWPEQNVVAPVQVFARANVEEAWHPVGATVFYRLRQDGGETASPPFAIETAPPRYLRIRVDPRAGALGEAPPTLSAGWLPQTLVFAARGRGPFELAYGSARAKPAALPIATLVPGYDNRTTPATLALAAVGPASVAPALDALRPPLDGKRWLLWGTLVLAALALGAMAVKLSRQMSGVPASPEHDATVAANAAPPRDGTS